MSKSIQPLTSDQERFVRMSAQGKSRPEILKAVFGLDIETDEVKQILYGCTAEAVQVIKGQLRSDQGWLQNKAANDLLNYGKGQIYGDEERTVHVQIEGLPDIGSPDDDG